MTIFPILAGAVDVKNTITAQAVANTTPVTGTAVNVAAYEGTLLAVLNAGAASTSDTLDCVIEESSDNSTWAAIPSDALFNPVTGANATFAQVTDAAASFQALGIKKERVKQYLRAKVTAAGTTISIPVAVCFVCPKRDF